MAIPKATSFFAILLFINTVAVAQSTISGRVTDAETGQPLPGVNVYLANTTIGDGSNNDGLYTIKTTLTGDYQLVFSFTGYNKGVVPLTLSASGQSSTINITLNPKTYALGELKVSGSRDEKWQKQFEIFQDQFIGETAFAEQTTIKNPYVLEFHTGNKALIATAPEPLIVINRALGYKLYLELVTFSWQGKKQNVKYEIYPKFEELNPRNNQQAKRWIENRVSTYLGSFTHFLKSLHSNTLKQHHFRLRWPSGLDSIKQSRTRYELFERGVSKRYFERYRGFKLDERVKVLFDGEIEYAYRGKAISLSVEKTNSIKPNTEAGTFFVRDSGQLLDPTSIVVMDDWANDRIANTLPTNYNFGQ